MITTSPTSTPAATDPARLALQRRIDALRREVRAAEAKIPRTINAINARKRILSRLEANIALMDESRPALPRNE